ncbi:MAG: hypothetical protein K0S75_1968 [Clostridia bacterium]|jgi:hypothetical protein|nr:hypothetical protein [Clostridia bacterium]
MGAAFFVVQQYEVVNEQNQYLNNKSAKFKICTFIIL